MKLKILGSAAGGGFPQWNCNYRLSRAARSQAPTVRPRLQSSLAATSSAERGWVLFNASPDIRQQINETPELHPAADGPVRATPIRAVVVTNADVDHIAGLLSLRERQPFNLYATARILSVLDANPIFRVLDPAVVRRIPVALDQPFALEGPDGPTGLTAELFAVPGKVALFLETGERGVDFEADDEDTIGVRLCESAGGSAALYVPGCARVDAGLLSRLMDARLLLFDGTVFTDDEMAEAGVGQKTGRRMGHVPISGENGSLRAFGGSDGTRRVFVHINNTNPILDETSPERRMVEDAGWEVAFDGMEIEP